MSDETIEFEDAPPKQSEDERIASWRFSVLSRAGFPPSLAERVASTKADLHFALQLVGRGCPPHLAAEIVI